jgi:NAD(P)H-flavin reductase/ferredoxin
MAYTIHIADRDIAFDAVDARSILDNALAAGYEIPYSCRSGVCGSCRGRITAGEVRGGSGAGVLGEDERREGQVLLCQAHACSDVTVAVRDIARRDPDATKSVRAKVHKLTQAAPDVTVVHLRFPAGTKVRFKAGQYLHARLEDGTVRHYSMANPPTQNDGVELHVRHVAGGRFTAHLAGEMQVGHFLDVTLPFGDFTVREADSNADSGSDPATEAVQKPMILIASGTGFAPIKSIVEDAIKARRTRPMTLYWGARHAEDLYLADLPMKWAAKHPWFRFVPVLSDAAVSDEFPRTGYVHQAVMDDHPTLAGHEVYACGSPVMIQAARQAFVDERNLPRDAFFCDAFVPAVVPDEAFTPA